MEFITTKTTEFQVWHRNGNGRLDCGYKSPQEAIERAWKAYHDEIDRGYQPSEYVIVMCEWERTNAGSDFIFNSSQNTMIISTEDLINKHFPYLDSKE